MISYQEEHLSIELKEEIEPLLMAHWEEIAHFKDIPLVIDWDKYFTMFKMDLMRAYVARDNGEIIGYNVFFVHSHMHYNSTIQAMEDILYLKPEYRGRMAGLKLIKFADEKLKLAGVDVVHRHLKAAHDYSPMLERIGYELTDKIYSKRVN